MVNRYVVDTDVNSYLYRGDSRAGAFRSILNGGLLLVSFMSIAELDHWALTRNRGGVRTRRLEEFLADFTLVLPDRALCRTWAESVN